MSSIFAVRSANMFAMPVILPPGLAKLLTKPEPMGSVDGDMMIGIVDVARCAAAIAGVASAIMTSGLSATSSATRFWQQRVVAIRFAKFYNQVLSLLISLGFESFSEPSENPIALPCSDQSDAPWLRWMGIRRGGNSKGTGRRKEDATC